MAASGRDLIGAGDSLAVESYRQRLLSAFEVKPGKGRRVLDLGCGDGLEAVYFARLGYKVEAVDIEAHSNWARLEKESRGLIRFKLADAASLKKFKAGYDLVFEKDMLHHVDDPGLVLREMRRLLKAGGLAMIAECNRYNPVFYVHLTLMGGHQHFSRARLRSLLASAGMDAHRLRLRETRVWPVQSAGFQKLMDKVQDLVEAVHVLDPWLCYHLVSWEKPRG